MKRTTIQRAGLTLLLASTLLGCSSGSSKWQSPASAEQLAQIEGITLKRETPPKHRAELLFLWGQELSQQAKQTQDQQSASDLRAKAIAAFTRVVDMHNVLLKEARFNLEILWKEEAQQNGSNQNPDQKDQQKQDGKQGQNGDQKDSGNQQQGDKKDGSSQQDGKQSKADSQSGAQQGKDAQQAKEAKDLSSLVREKAGESDLDKAVKAEQARLAQKQQVSAGKATAVAKDW